MRLIFLFSAILFAYALTRSFSRRSPGISARALACMIIAGILITFIMQLFFDYSFDGKGATIRFFLVLLSLVLITWLLLVDLRVPPSANHPSAPSWVAAIVTALAIFAAIGLHYWFDESVSQHAWGFRAGVQLLEALALDAFVAGCVIGFIVADQQSAYERLSQYLAEPNEDRSSWIPVLKGSGNAALLIALIVVAALPPNTLMELTRRLGGVKMPGGFELTVAPDSRRREGPTPVSQTSPPESASFRGFSQPRLDQMISLTFAPRQEFRAAINPSAALGLRAADRASGHNATVSRHIERDRAYLVLLGWGAEALYVDTSYHAPDRRPPSHAIHGIDRFGYWQERFLLALGPYIECIKDYVAVTGDRRVLAFEAMEAVRPLVAFTVAYRELENIWVRRWFVDNITEQEWNEIVDLERDLKDHAGSLQDRATRIRQGLSAWANRPSARPGEGERRACEAREGEPSLNDLVDQVLFASRISSMRVHGFAPYLTIFTAAALSGLSEERQAQQLLYRWLDTRAEIEAALILLAERPQMREAGPASQDLALVRRALKWHRLQVATEAIWLRWAAERSGERTQEVIPTSRATAVTVDSLFPLVFDQIDRARAIDPWLNRGNQRDICRQAKYQWRQNLMDSYFAFVRGHLDTLFKEVTSPRDLNHGHLELAKMLADVNVDCFQDYGYTENYRRLIGAFNITTSLTIRLAAMREAVASRIPPRLSATDQEQLIILDVLLQTAERHSEALARGQGACKNAADESLCLALNNPDTDVDMLVRKVRVLRRQMEALRELSDR
jgi:hypothetical protein